VGPFSLLIRNLRFRRKAPCVCIWSSKRADSCHSPAVPGFGRQHTDESFNREVSCLHLDTVEQRRAWLSVR